MQIAQTALLPFNNTHKIVPVPEGLSIKQAADIIFPHKVNGLRMVVLIGSDIIPPEKWSSIYPKQNAIVTYNIVPTGGGSKSIIGALFAAAAVFIAPYLAPTAFAAVSAASMGLGTATLGQYLTVAAIKIGLGIVTTLASSMLASTPSQSGSNPSRGGAVKESQTQFIEGASNAILRYGVIPVNLGTNRMFPPQAALPYMETAGNNQYARQLFTFGFGEIVVNDERIGETAISEFTGVEKQYRLTGNLNSPTTIYARDAFQESMSVKITQTPAIRTTQPDSAEAEVDITFPSGLVVFNDEGSRNTTFVDFTIMFAPTGTENWSTGESPKSVSAQTLTMPDPVISSTVGSNPGTYEGPWTIGGSIYINKLTGAAVLDDPGENRVKIGEYTATTDKNTSVWNPNTNEYTNTTYRTYDTRSAIWAANFVNSYDFAVTDTGNTINIAAGMIKPVPFRASAATTQSVRVTKRLNFPTAGTYDIQVKTVLPDSAFTSNNLRAESFWSALKSFNPGNPVLQEDVSGVAMRFLATDQLNGSVDRYNAVVSTVLDYYEPTDDAWIRGISSCPAAMFRYVLQSPAFAKRLPDNRIDIEKLEEWATYCRQKGFTYDNVVDYDTSVDDLIADICAAGMATVHKANGIYSVIIDNERPIVKALITPRNSWGYSGGIIYPEIPHALLVQFRNREKGYLTDERIVYADGYNASNATLFERLEFKSCTDASLAYYYGRRYLATAILQREVHSFNQDFETLTYSRGDRVTLVNDSILVGVGQGRVKEIVLDEAETHIAGIVLDEQITVPPVSQFGMRVRHADASGFVWYGLQTISGTSDTFSFTTPIAYTEGDEDKWITSLVALTEFDKELDLIVTDIRHNKDNSARITCMNYAQERFDVDNDPIPAWESNITIPLEFQAPYAPKLFGTIVSDESVMSRNPDGSYTSRMIINLTNDNGPNITPVISIRVTGTEYWYKPDTLALDPQTIVLTGLQNNTRYDMKIYYQRIDSPYVSKPLELNSVRFVGTSTPPPDVSTFRVSASGTTGHFEWSPVDVIDLSHYEIRFTNLTSGVQWYNSQTISTNIIGNRLSMPIQAGTYLIKAYDFDGNSSENATLITSYDAGAFTDVVELLQQQPDWDGTHVNTQVIDDNLYLIDTSETGYYYFDPEPLDLSEVYQNVLSYSVIASGVVYNKIRSVPSIRALDSIRDVSGSSVVGNASVRAIPSIRGIDSIRGIEQSAWSVVLEFNTSLDDVTWSGWTPAQAGSEIFRYIKFRLVLNSYQSDISPSVSTAEAVVNMPDRQESAEDVVCLDTGMTVTYSTPFKNNPSVQITVQDQAVDDRLEYVAKDNTGFTIKVYNSTVDDYVERTFDYISSGYGRVIE